jgi:hypothetical protein
VGERLFFGWLIRNLEISATAPRRPRRGSRRAVHTSWSKGELSEPWPFAVRCLRATWLTLLVSGTSTARTTGHRRHLKNQSRPLVKTTQKTTQRPRSACEQAAACAPTRDSHHRPAVPTRRPIAQTPPSSSAPPRLCCRNRPLRKEPDQRCGRGRTARTPSDRRAASSPRLLAAYNQDPKIPRDPAKARP